MSNALAIAAVTATLRDRIFAAVSTGGMSGTAVTVLPPDRARTGVTGGQVNLFLYETALDASWRNVDLSALPGETGHPPLPLALRYLVSAYGPDEADGLDPIDHLLLGLAMRALHDTPVLSRAEIRAALADNDLFAQVERVRITPHPLTLDEMSTLWTGFQTHYRVSAAYQACVVLIESEQPGAAPLPVLTRGPGDCGPVAQADTAPAAPTITAVEPPAEQPSAVPGDTVVVRGHHLAAATGMRLTHRRSGGEVLLGAAELASVADDELRFVLPATPATLTVGIHTAAVVLDAGRTTNELPLVVAPMITSPLPLAVNRDGSGVAAVQLDCTPEVRPGQQTFLLLGGRLVRGPALTASAATLSFTVPAAPLGTHVLRLRVDGVDTRVVDRSARPPVFDPGQAVMIS